MTNGCLAGAGYVQGFVRLIIVFTLDVCARVRYERGITVSSNIGKVYERIKDNRTRPQIKISEAQAGGREGRSTTDHLTILKESIATQKKRKNPLYMVYIDVTKAYDNPWLDALLYVLSKRAIETENWQITNDIY